MFFFWSSTPIFLINNHYTNVNMNVILSVCRYPSINVSFCVGFQNWIIFSTVFKAFHIWHPHLTPSVEIWLLKTPEEFLLILLQKSRVKIVGYLIVFVQYGISCRSIMTWHSTFWTQMFVRWNLPTNNVTYN